MDMGWGTGSSDDFLTPSTDVLTAGESVPVTSGPIFEDQRTPFTIVADHTASVVVQLRVR